MIVPSRVRVSKLLSARYPGLARPRSWDDRREGIDIVRTSDGQEIKLLSDGGQNPPKAGWELMLTRETGPNTYRWTLFGISPEAPVS